MRKVMTVMYGGTSGRNREWRWRRDTGSRAGAENGRGRRAGTERYGKRRGGSLGRRRPCSRWRSGSRGRTKRSAGRRDRAVGSVVGCLRATAGRTGRRGGFSEKTQKRVVCRQRVFFRDVDCQLYLAHLSEFTPHYLASPIPDELSPRHMNIVRTSVAGLPHVTESSARPATTRPSRSACGSFLAAHIRSACVEVQHGASAGVPALFICSCLSERISSRSRWLPFALRPPYPEGGVMHQHVGRNTNYPGHPHRLS